MPMLRRTLSRVPALPRNTPVLRPLLLCSLLVLIGLPVLSGGPARAQLDGDPHANRPLPAVRLPAGAVPPDIDGDVTDPAWRQGARAVTFYDPQSGKPAPDQTEAFLLYDQKYVYVAFYCHDSQPAAIVARETVRDADMENDDTVRITLDPFLTRKYEDYSVFVVNPIGTRHTYQGGGRAGKAEWQGDWMAATKRVQDGWTAEMRIPWQILPYPRTRGPMRMGLNFQRMQQRTKLQSMWSDVGPQYFNDRDGTWQGVEAPVHAWRPRFSALPYLLPSSQAGGGHGQIQAGVDVRYQPTPELTSVGTLNPDFSTVEGAVQSVGFTRSERFVPDQRPFFQEGTEYTQLGQFYQLGLLFDSSTITKVDAGGKLYGKLMPQTTLGTLGTFSLHNQANVVTQLRQQFGPTAGANLLLMQRLAPGEDNTVLALASNARRGKWSVDGQFAQTAGVEAGGAGWTSAVNLEDKNLFTTLRYRYVAPNFQDRLGYIPFTDYMGWSSFTDWSAQWRHGALRSFDVFFSPTWDWHTDGSPFRREADFGVYFETRRDNAFGAHLSGGKFDSDTDFTYGLDFGGNVSNRYRKWRFSFTTGQQASLPFTSFAPQISLRLFRKFDIAVSSYIENYQGVTQQHILTFNYEISPYRSWGGRLVIENDGINFFLSYHNSGRLGTDTYFIIGDPNAKSFVPRVTLKFVFAI
jgi:hypothetical protein